tara:strand:- start:2339 stop:3376 length:1038 start_codon:yes stop_codon:yes gene_type:complete
MNRFVTINKQKVSRNFIGDLNIFNTIAEHIDSNMVFCVCGPPGVGKTYMVNMLLNGKEWVSAAQEIESYSIVVIDEVSIDKNILEGIKKIGKLSKLSTILITQNSSGIDFCPIINVPKATVDVMLKIANKGQEFLNLALLCDGNIRNFLNALEFNFVPDNFAEPRQIVKGLLGSGTQNLEPWSILSKGISDHGYMWSIVHENAIDSQNWDHRIADSMSMADIYDGLIFAGNWDFMRYFTIEAFIKPALQLEHTLDTSKMRAGSSWTKYNNQKMRIKKVRSMGLDIDRIHTIKDMCRDKTENHLETLKHYKITRQDLDIINHLALVNKIKTRDLMRLKKEITADTK